MAVDAFGAHKDVLARVGVAAFVGHDVVFEQLGEFEEAHLGEIRSAGRPVAFDLGHQLGGGFGAFGELFFFEPLGELLLFFGIYLLAFLF